MIGLIFSILVSIWLAIAMFAAAWLGKYLPKNRLKIPLIAMIFLGIFFLPVADELIALPAMNSLCETVTKYTYDERLARGRILRPEVSGGGQEVIFLFPGIKVVKERFEQKDATTGEPILSWFQVTTYGGVVGIPSSSSERYPLILPQRCSIPGGAVTHAKLLRDLQITMPIWESKKQ